MTITVIGTPAPQGSKSFRGMSKNGHAILTESSKKLRPWRLDVKLAAMTERENSGHYPAFRGPVCVEITFTMPKPQSAPKRRKAWPDRKPDIDKLVRGVLDSLKDAGCIEDDSRVVSLNATKVFPGEGNGSLGVPGAVICIRRAQEATDGS